ncbi:trehalose-6-phosphate synthase [Candidatus Curtissbacteria bacterium RBG_13_35_7]|uniref:Trehalose-6-phosphate synthase n=1 Tax=Candidatus Curtissbacteria bacterium RBG_13_35_7 TaxID=1797705 RepID=A0A1F5G350_9BACT|nr:MAG: trehalose-6-phosphate synthase [Candidatus Curtissbacteria bacterium RBG_13_35_7]
MFKNLKDYLFVVVSNRQPYIHRFEGKKIKYLRSTSGVAIPLDPIMKTSQGLWIAHGSGDADKKVVNKFDHIKLPPDKPKYTLRRVWLTKAEEDGYYYGFSNEGLWPLCHIAFTRPKFDKPDWETYKKVNQKFANTILKEIKNKKAFVFIQDYHFALLPLFIREKHPDCIIAQFWHIPWPNPEAFRICPWRKQIIRGLLANDLLGFNIRYYCQNFLDTVNDNLEAKVNLENFEVTRRHHSTLIRSYPISVDYEDLNSLAREKSTTKLINKFQADFNLKNKKIGLGIDRLDYTKGIPERLRAIEIFLKKNPKYIGKFTFIQIAVPSRTHIQKYKDIKDEIENLVEEINFKYQTNNWKPIIYIKRDHSKKELSALYNLCHFCIVSALHDGMNLIAKEFIASRIKENGALILSLFTGSSRELVDALLVNPYSTYTFARIIKRAIEMPQTEQRIRMKKMRELVQNNNVYLWAGRILSDLLKLETSI